MSSDKSEIETAAEIAVLRAEIAALRASVDSMTTMMHRQGGDSGGSKTGFDWAGEQLEDLRRLWDGVNALMEERSPDAARELVKDHPLSSLFAAFSLGLAFTTLFSGKRH